MRCASLSDRNLCLQKFVIADEAIVCVYTSLNANELQHSYYVVFRMHIVSLSLSLSSLGFVVCEIL